MDVEVGGSQYSTKARAGDTTCHSEQSVLLSSMYSHTEISLCGPKSLLQVKTHSLSKLL